MRALCHRRTGIGADGVLVVARTEGHPEVGEQAAEAPYFMDYRNGDGSPAQMCGNGARVFAEHLVALGLATREGFSVATRGGPRRATFLDDTRIAIDMGPAQFLDRDDILVRTAESPTTEHAAVGVLMPNPHAVVFVADVRAAGALVQAPVVTPGSAFPEGTNVEFVHRVADHHIRMRVFERGVGETLSCGTGACAAAVASAQASGSGIGRHAHPGRCPRRERHGHLAPRRLGRARRPHRVRGPRNHRSVVVGGPCLRPQTCSTARRCGACRG